MPTDGTLISSASNYNLIDIINKGLAYAIIAAGLLSVFFIFYGGFLFILSGGQEDKIKKAVGTIRYAIIGLVISIFAVIIVGVLGRFLGVDVLQYINFNDVIQNVQNLSQSLTNSGGGRGGLGS